MTESVWRRIQLDLLLGAYGSIVTVIDCPSAVADGIYARQTSLGSAGETDGTTYAEHQTVAQAIRAFADRLDALFGDKQGRALLAWHTGAVTSYEELLAQYGTGHEKNSGK